MTNPSPAAIKAAEEIWRLSVESLEMNPQKFRDGFASIIDREVAELVAVVKVAETIVRHHNETVAEMLRISLKQWEAK